MFRYLLLIFFLASVNPCSAQENKPMAGIKPPVPQISLKNASDSGHCKNVKILFTTPGADTVKISIREDSAGIPGRWYTNKSNPRAKDADYKGLKENIDYDFQVEAINKYGRTMSPILTRKSCR